MYKFESPERTFITSDWHGFHKNICRGCTSWDEGATRDFDNPTLMTIKLADNINSVVGTDDWIINLGDWSFGGKDKIKKLRDMINCKNIILVTGNHDHHIESDVRDGEYRKLFSFVHGKPGQSHYIDVKVGEHQYFCGHYAMRVWDKSHHGVRHLFGHSHGSLPDDPNSLSFDAGVDCHNLMPINFVEVEEIMSRKVYKPKDHHNSGTN